MSFLKRLTVYRYSVYNEVKELELYLPKRAYRVKYKVIFNTFKQTLFIKQCMQNMAQHYSRAEVRPNRSHNLTNLNTKNYLYFLQ